MMFENINAANFDSSTSFYTDEFQNILRGIIACYQLISSLESKLPNDENKIRNHILNEYLKVQEFKEKHRLTNYLFLAEQPVDEGRIDISIFSLNELVIDQAFYSIECKRLDSKNLKGITGLNSKYIKNGVCRFVYDFYSSYFGINGMVGFVVDNLDIDNNITNLNSLLNKDLIDDKGKIVNAMPHQEIKPIQLNEDFKYSYISIHQTTSQNEITLYHLMFDFSKNIACT